jgi:hypothetical protein
MKCFARSSLDSASTPSIVDAMAIPEVIWEHDFDDDMGECSIEHEESTCWTSSPIAQRSLIGRSPPSKPQERSCWSPQSMPSLEASDAASLSPSSTLSLSPLSSSLSRSLLDGENEDDEDCYIERSKLQQYSLPPMSSSPRCISSSLNVMDVPVPHPVHPSCGPPPWMCVFDLDDSPHPAGDIEFKDSSGCHDFHSEGLLPLVFNWFAGCEGGGGTEPHSSSLHLSAPQLLTSGSPDSPLHVPQSRTQTRCPRSVVRASTFLYAPCDQSIEALFVPVCSRWHFL